MSQSRLQAESLLEVLASANAAPLLLSVLWKFSGCPRTLVRQFFILILLLKKMTSQKDFLFFSNDFRW